MWLWVHSLTRGRLDFSESALVTELNEGDLSMSFKVNVGRSFLLRAKHDSEMIDFVTGFAKENEVMAASFTAIGALKSAKLGFYDQEKHEYSEMSLSVPLEIACCIGNVSLKGGKPFTHAHVVLSDHNGNTRGGHLLEGKVFAAEVYLTELTGAELVRKIDAVTGLSLWDINLMSRKTLPGL